MLSLQNILSTEGQEFMDNLMNKEVIVNEKLNAATLSFQKKRGNDHDLNRKLCFFKGSGVNKREITVADKVMTTFYAAGMTYLNNLSKLIIDRIPANWTFVCRYFPSHQPSFINYSVLPKNNLVLSCIITSGGTKIDDADDLRSWAEMFDIAYQEPVFRGYMSQYQKEQLMDYMKDSSHNKESFSKFIITLLNPSLTHSLYQDEGFNNPIDGFVFKFISSDGVTKPVSAKLIDPYMSELIAKNKSKKGFTDNTDVLLSDFAVFMSGQDMDSIVLTGKTDNDRYLELFYRLFNRYIKYKKAQLEDFDVDTNDVVKESIDIDFGINFDEISNETTKKLLKDNPEYKSIFKTLLGSFQTKKPEGYKSIVMSPGVVRLFNSVVDDIATKATQGCETGNMSFSSYLDSIHSKTLNDLDIKNAPEGVQKAAGFHEPELEIKDHTGLALSFSDFKKEDDKKSEEQKQDKKLKSIEDMIKDLKDKVADLSDEVKKSKEAADDAKDAAEDAEEKASEEKESSDDKKEDKKDDKETKEEKSDDKEDKDEDTEDDKEESTDEEKSDDGDDSGEESPIDKLSGL